MIILAIKTDRPDAELWLYADKKQLAYVQWSAHLKLAETIHLQIEELLDKSKNKLGNIGGIICFQGPGSFTGLRIGLSVANALASANNIPVVARRGRTWLEQSVNDLLAGQNDRLALPYYDQPPKTTKPKS